MITLMRTRPPLRLRLLLCSSEAQRRWRPAPGGGSFAVAEELLTEHLLEILCNRMGKGHRLVAGGQQDHRFAGRQHRSVLVLARHLDAHLVAVIGGILAHDASPHPRGVAVEVEAPVLAAELTQTGLAR